MEMESAWARAGCRGRAEGGGADERGRGIPVPLLEIQRTCVDPAVCAAYLKRGSGRRGRGQGQGR